MRTSGLHKESTMQVLQKKSVTLVTPLIHLSLIAEANRRIPVLRQPLHRVAIRLLRYTLLGRLLHMLVRQHVRHIPCKLRHQSRKYHHQR